jgi:hypothetical protein
MKHSILRDCWLILVTVIVFATTSTAQTACKVIYTISPQNTSAFGAQITIDNTGTTAWTSWTLTWTFPNGQTVSQLWNGIETQSGANVTVKNEPYNGSVAAGGMVSGVGFNGTWNGTTNTAPTSFAVNGTTCGATGGFTLKPTLPSLSIPQNASGTDTITVADVTPFAGPVTLAATGLPTGVTAAFVPNPTSSTSVLTLTVGTTTIVETYNVTITGTSGSLTATTTIVLNVTARSTFTLTVPSLFITQGKTATDTITINDVGGFTGNVTLAVSGLPSGVTCSFGTNPVIGTTNVMSCTASPTATVGNFIATITGTSGTITAASTFQINVASSTGGFTLSVSPAAPSVAPGGTVNVTITVTDVSPFAGAVTISYPGQSTNPIPVTISGCNSPIIGNGSCVLTITVPSTATPGAVVFALTATSGTFTATTTFTLTVTAGFSVSASCGSGLTLQQGGSATCTITVTGATATPSISVSGLPSGVTAIITHPTTTTWLITFMASSTASPGAFTSVVTVTSGAVSKSITLSIMLTPSSETGSFTISPTASALTINQNAGGTDTIHVTDVGGFNGPVTLTASGMPSGVTASWSANPTTNSSVLSLIASSSATSGTATITIQGTSTGTSFGTLQATTTIALTVSSKPDVQIAWVSPAAGIVGSTFTVMPGTGTSFAETQGSSAIYFGTTEATVTTWAIDSIAVTVPSLPVGSYNVTAVVGGVTSNAFPFTITSATPSLEQYTGNGTWFTALGSPYGGCGVPQEYIDSQNFVALNVQNDPGNYTLTLSRPISTTGEYASDIGLWNNGLNCGRWVHITMGDNCNGTNDGNEYLSFCRGGLGWVADQFTGAELDLVVADSCQDENAWCRDDPYHLDQAQAALNNYTINGAPAGDMYPNYWNNRQINWYFEPAPNYTGDINIGFLNGANAYWSAISITHLPNGIHGVQYLLNGVWTTAVMDADLGDDYIVLPTVAGGTQYEIQVFDVTNTLINNGRIYSFSYPASCGSSCTPALTPVTYTTSQ